MKFIFPIFFLLGVSLLALTSVEGYHGYLLFAWMYGTFLGGFHYTLSVFTLEKVRIRHFSRAWGYVQGAKALPFLIGLPMTGYINHWSDSPKSGFYFSFVCVLVAAASLFVMDCFHNHKNNNRHDCKGEGVMTGGNNNNNLLAAEQMVLNEMMSDPGKISVGPPPSSVGGAQAALQMQNFLRCTCDHAHAPPPGAGSVIQDDAGPSVGSRRLSLNNGVEVIVDPEGGVQLLVDSAALSAGNSNCVVEDENLDDIEDKIMSFHEIREEEEEDEDVEVDGDDVDEDEDEEEGGIIIPKPELLPCISEENIFDNMDVDFFGDCIVLRHKNSSGLPPPQLQQLQQQQQLQPLPGIRKLRLASPEVIDSEDEEDLESSPGQSLKFRLLAYNGKGQLPSGGLSVSEPDLARLFISPDCGDSPLLGEAQQHPLAVAAAAAPTLLTVNPIQNGNLNRQKTWHHFKGATAVAAAAAAAAAAAGSALSQSQSQGLSGLSSSSSSSHEEQTPTPSSLVVNGLQIRVDEKPASPIIKKGEEEEDEKNGMRKKKKKKLGPIQEQLTSFV